MGGRENELPRAAGTSDGLIETCKACRFFLTKKTAEKPFNSFGTCRRYPPMNETWEDNWCGEWQQSARET